MRHVSFASLPLVTPISLYCNAGLCSSQLSWVRGNKVDAEAAWQWNDVTLRAGAKNCSTKPTAIFLIVTAAPVIPS